MCFLQIFAKINGCVMKNKTWNMISYLLFQLLIFPHKKIIYTLNSHRIKELKNCVKDLRLISLDGDVFRAYVLY